MAAARTLARNAIPNGTEFNDSATRYLDDVDDAGRNQEVAAAMAVVRSAGAAHFAVIGAAAPDAPEAAPEVMDEGLLPVWLAVAHVSEAIGDQNIKHCYPKSIEALRHAAENGALEIWGRKQNPAYESQYWLNHTLIDPEYWRISTINVLSTDRNYRDHYHTLPRRVESWGRRGIYERKRYADLQVNAAQLAALWPISRSDAQPADEPRSEEPAAMPIEERTIADYIRSSPRVARLTDAIAHSIGAQVLPSDSEAASLSELTLGFGIDEIAALDALLRAHEHHIVPMSHYVRHGHTIGRGHCLQILFEILGACLATPDDYYAIVAPLAFNSITLAWACEVRRAYQQILKSDHRRQSSDD
jgi:hypothetical protein